MIMYYYYHRADDNPFALNILVSYHISKRPHMGRRIMGQERNAIMRLSATTITLALASLAVSALAQTDVTPPILPVLPTQAAASQPVGKKIKVLCSVYPVWLFTKNVAAGSNLQIDLMLPGNLGCPHDYALTPQDMRKIAAAEVLIVNGAGLEEFLGEPVKKANPKVKIIDASAGIKDLIQMKDEDETGRADAGHKEEGHHHHAGANPHLFAAPRMAAKMVQNITDELAKVDPENAKLYAATAKDYAARLNKVADEFVEAAKAFKSRKIVTEHAVFDYLAKGCGLEIVAVVEEAPGQEPSAAQMLDIVKKIKASGAAAIFTEPQYPAKVAQTIAKEAKVPVAALDPVASGPDDAASDYYEKTMRANLETLKKVLGGENK
jgi:zinc transport system substrate-binding protein